MEDVIREAFGRHKCRRVTLSLVPFDPTRGPGVMPSPGSPQAEAGAPMEGAQTLPDTSSIGQTRCSA